MFNMTIYLVRVFKATRLCCTVQVKALNATAVTGGGYSHTLTIRVCAAGQGMVFRTSSLEHGM